MNTEEKLAALRTVSAHKDKVDEALNDIINLRDKEPENISITHGHAFRDCAFQIHTK